MSPARVLFRPCAPCLLFAEDFRSAMKNNSKSQLKFSRIDRLPQSTRVLSTLCLLSAVASACLPGQRTNGSTTRVRSTVGQNAGNSIEEPLDPPGCVLRYVHNAGGGNVPMLTQFGGKDSVPLAEGTYVCVLGLREQGSWAKVNVGTATGYMPSDYLKCDTRGTDPVAAGCQSPQANSLQTHASNPAAPGAAPGTGSTETRDGRSTVGSQTIPATGSVPSTAPQGPVASSGASTAPNPSSAPQPTANRGAAVQSCKLVLPRFNIYFWSWVDCKVNGAKVVSFKPDSVVQLYKQMSGDKYQLAAHPYCFFDNNNVDPSSCRDN